MFPQASVTHASVFLCARTLIIYINLNESFYSANTLERLQQRKQVTETDVIMLFLTNHSFSLFTFFPFSLLMWPANSALLCKSEKVWCGTQGVLGSHHVGNSSSSPRVLQGPTLQPVAARPFKMMVLFFRRGACSLSPVHVQILCDSFLCDKSTCSRTRRKPSFPNASEITANINRRDVDDSQRGVHFTGKRFCLTQRLGHQFSATVFVT